MNKKTNKKSIITNNYCVKLFVIFALILVSISAISYATIYEKETQEDENTLTTGCFSTDFRSGSSIKLEKAYPQSDEDGLDNNRYHFEITNTCSVASSYYVILSTTKSSFSNSYIKYSYNGSVPVLLSNAKNNDIYKVDDNYNNTYILATGALGRNDTASYDLNLWLDNDTNYEDVKDQNWEGEILVVNSVANLNISEYKPNFGSDISNANAPKLVDNLIPVVYDEDMQEWIKTSNSQINWYNYDKKIWANAVTIKESLRNVYNDAIEGTIIPTEAILGMYVWIPKFTYNPDNIQEITFTSNENYITHPAFLNASETYETSLYTTLYAYQLGGWDSALTGFWFGKFETGGTDLEPIVKPNVKALTNYNIFDSYNIAKKISEYQNITLDSHLSKNSEWGAVAYLSKSKYGNETIFPNNSALMYTGRSLGTLYDENTLENDLGSYEYNTNLGVNSSTTGNIYGVYDMAGGSSEYVMGINTKNIENSAVISINNIPFNDMSSHINHKYYDEYSFDTSSDTPCGNLVCYGHALFEINMEQNGETIYNDTTHPWLIRGGDYSYANENYGGIFYYNYDYGTANITYGFRVVLT